MWPFLSSTRRLVGDADKYWEAGRLCRKTVVKGQLGVRSCQGIQIFAESRIKCRESQYRRSIDWGLMTLKDLFVPLC